MPVKKPVPPWIARVRRRRSIFGFLATVVLILLAISLTFVAISFIEALGRWLA
jgi:hypothetical protein